MSLAQDMRSRMGVSVPSRQEATVKRVSTWKLAATPFVVGDTLRLLVVAFVQVLHGNFLFLDDQGDDQIGWALAQAWHMGRFPSPQSVAITNSYFYYVFVAVVYFAFGRHWVMIKLLAALLSALSVPAAAAIGSSLGGRRLVLERRGSQPSIQTRSFGAQRVLRMARWRRCSSRCRHSATATDDARLAGAVALIVVAFLSRPVEGAIGLAMLVVSSAELREALE